MTERAHKILLPVDFSEGNESLLSFATSLARDRSARLLIAHVFDPPSNIHESMTHAGLPEKLAEDQHAQLVQVIPPDPQVAYEHRLLHGVPGDAIVELAEQEAVELIVIGTHGRTGLRRLLMGSVAEYVVRHATCPVITVKLPSP